MTLPEQRREAQIVASAKLPSRFGEFTIVAFTNIVDHKEHVAVIKGDVHGQTDVPTRLHSECLTGDVTWFVPLRLPRPIGSGLEIYR